MARFNYFLVTRVKLKHFAKKVLKRSLTYLLLCVWPMLSYASDLNDYIRKCNKEINCNGYSKTILNDLKNKQEYRANFKKSIYLESCDPYEKNKLSKLLWLFENSEENDHVVRIDCYLNIALFLTELGDHQNSLYYAGQALILAKKHEPDFIHRCYYGFGMTYFKMGSFDKSIFYIKKVLKSSENQCYSNRYSSFMNIGIAYKKKENYEAYFKYTQKAISVINHAETHNAITDYDRYIRNYLKINVADYYHLKKNYAKSNKIAKQLTNYFFSVDVDGKLPELLKLIRANEECLSKNVSDNTLLLEAVNFLRTNGEYKYSEQLAKFLLEQPEVFDNKDQKFLIEKYLQSVKKNDLIENKNMLDLSSFNLRYRNHLMTNISTLKEENNTYFNSIIVAAVVIVTLTISIMLYFRMKTFRKNILYLNEINSNANLSKKIAEQELELKNEKLTRLSIANEIKFSTHLDLLEDLKRIKRRKTISVEEVIRIVRSRINTIKEIDEKNNSKREEVLLEKQEFMDRMAFLYPKLSRTDLVLCSYLRLELKARQIAELEGITEATVRVYKTKLKAKLNISQNQKLEDFLKSI